MFFIRLFLANTWEKNRGSPCLFPHKLLWKVDMVLRSQSGWIICAAGTGARYNRKAASYLSSRMKFCPINSLWVLQVYPEPTFVTEGKSESKERRTKRGTIKLTSRQTAPLTLYCKDFLWCPYELVWPSKHLHHYNEMIKTCVYVFSFCLPYNEDVHCVL